ncbi:DUF11 domain-containing protein [Wenzhouxiangella sp. XN79A]|uniref:endonuclease/exonuclease/phosphatase family protein n=1 Tax=Wenzhouxiangella sp. XN79A TaxID=2724193 RepID=UPI00144A8047|nr:endonuclease/exonuclease/phosphatase family protein [Wenzhouxiangella sp. XN79A]NKI34049.1 DUF11 domain-containing protein [Wenzhouxiangella sp. XN79A]
MQHSMISRAAGALLVLTLSLSAAAGSRGGPFFSEDFTGFTGGGFAPTPASGQLDSDLWRVTGLSDGDGSFGGTHDSGDFARGAAAGGASTGGIYGFDTGGGDRALGAQPTSGDFSPGTFELRVENTTGATLQAVDVAYDIKVFNDQDRGNTLNFAWSTDGATFTAVPELDFTSTELRDSPASWATVPRATTLIGISVPAGGNLFLRWTSDDAIGGGSRDELAIDNVTLTAAAPPAVVLATTGPAVGLAGENLTYTIEFSNPSTTEALDSVELVATLPTGFSYVSDTAGPTASVGAGTVTWSFGTVAAGASASFELVVATDAGLPADATRTNTVDLTATQGGSPVTEQATFDTVFRELVTTTDIQQVADATIDDASPLVGRTVFVDGVVTAAPGEFDNPGLWVIQDGTGPWSGLVVDGDTAGAVTARGDSVRVLGTVGESNGLTELALASVEVTGSAAVPAPTLLATGAFPDNDPAASEPYEAVLVEFNNVTVTDDTLDFGEWLFSDGSGNARGDDAASINIAPALNDAYAFLRGIGWFSFGNYKLEPRDDADFDFQPDVFTIEEIQGTGLRSPFAPATGNDPGQVVRVEGAIVTAVAGNGFFVQMPDGTRGGLDPASRGLFVFTGSAPTVSVGDAVNINGAVAEFFDFTQIAQPSSVEVVSSGNPLPAPVAFDGQVPSPDPTALSCGATQYECFEGMRVAVADGIVTAPSQSFGSDPVAEAVISTDGTRILRGKGAAFPGIPGCATCPVWSGAPELLEIDPDRFLAVTDPLAGGQRFSAEGVLGFSFGDFALWPTTLNLQAAPPLPDPVAPATPEMLTIGSLNALNLFDDTLGAPRPISVCGSTDDAIDREVLSAADYAIKLNKLAAYIVQGLNTPDVLALQEVESAAVLDDLAAEIQLLSGVGYTSYLEGGNDRGNINNGYLVNEARVTVDSVQLQAEAECLSSDGSPLHDRPPLVLRGTFSGAGQSLPFVVFNNHLRSLGGVDDPDGRTRLKRHEQAQSVATLVQDLQTAEPDLAIVLVGDYNAFQFSDGYADPIGHLLGIAEPSENLVSIENASTPGFDDSNIPNPPLSLPLDALPTNERYSFIFQKVSQVLDHALVTQAARPLLAGFEYSRGNADYWGPFESDVMTLARNSDHDGFVLMLDPDRIFVDGFESAP